MAFITRLVERVAEKLPRKTFHNIAGAYLTRYRVFDTDACKLFLHNFHRPDEDTELHNHPWAAAIAIVLSGGYVEERKSHLGDRVYKRPVRRFSVNILFADTFHCVASLDRDTWTVMLTGPRVQDWGFWDRLTGEFEQWEDFIRGKGQTP